MPNNKMDKKKLEEYKNMLLKLKEKIVDDIKQLSKDSNSKEDRNSDVSGHALHMADVATDMYDREFMLGLASNDRELLYKIDEALQRVQEKTFGVCVECEKSIPQQRLKAIPYAQTCLKCQEKIEEEEGYKK